MKPQDQTIIIIGAGAAGLMAAQKLAKRYKIILLEANNHIGGRVHTIKGEGFTVPVEAGAEFIHGKLPLTLRFLKEAGIQYEELRGNIYRVNNGEWIKQHEMFEGWNKLLKQMKKEKKNMTMYDFLQRHYPDEKYDEFRRHIQNFAEGFDVSDITKVSMKALYKEWSHADEKIFRIPGGHGQLISYLAKACKDKGCEIITASLIKQIDWEKNNVTVYTEDGRKYFAEKCIVTVPVSILQKALAKASINFTPPLDHHVKAANEAGYGTVIKVVFEFNEPFWEQYAKDVGFILGDETFPAWWTQYPRAIPLLTGWKGGPGATTLSNNSDEMILQEALGSLCAIFDIPMVVLKEKIIAAKVFNWLRDDYAGGAYSFPLISTVEAKEILNKPVDNTIFFAGEALFEGSAFGTVEAALMSGKEVAGSIMKG
jgi:monoamine oxidase